MKALPPGYTLVRQTEYMPAGAPPQGSVWAVDSTTGAATTVFTREADVVEAAWALYDRMAALLAAMQQRDKAA